jgi:putative FmdB family regulatory protein
MPTYEYRCKDCGESLEVVQAFTDDPLSECPACTGRLRKVFGSVGISFKGNGFYRTDSRTPAKGEGKGDGATGDGATKDGAKDAAAKKKESDGASSGSTKDSSSSGKSGSEGASTSSSSSSSSENKAKSA